MAFNQKIVKIFHEGILISIGISLIELSEKLTVSIVILIDEVITKVHTTYQI